MLLVSVSEHVLEVPLELDPEEEASRDLLDLDDLLPPLVKVDLDVVSRPIAPSTRRSREN